MTVFFSSFSSNILGMDLIPIQFPWIWAIRTLRKTTENVKRVPQRNRLANTRHTL